MQGVTTPCQCIGDLPGVRDEGSWLPGCCARQPRPWYSKSDHERRYTLGRKDKGNKNVKKPKKDKAMKAAKKS